MLEKLSTAVTTTLAALSHTAQRARDNALLIRNLAACAVDTDRPVMAHVVVTRRCNLSCDYCFEYDHVSAPVPLETMKQRLAHLASLGTVIVTLTGGEPLLNPDLVAIVREVRALGMIPAMNSNAYLLTRAHVDALSDAGLYAMQISIDNVNPGEVSKKSLRPLRKKLAMLSKHARFDVRINTVLGSSNPEDALTVTREVMKLGFDAKCSLLREESGALMPLDARTRAVYDEIRTMGKRSSKIFAEDFQVKMLADGKIDWKCRAGARFFTVCEQGLVHLCTPRYHSPAKALLDYTVDDIRRAFNAKKSCSATCPISYAHQGSQLDGWRQQTGPDLVAPKPLRVHLPMAS